ncbi:Transcriptional regulatory protein YycF [Candidatus Sulfobium mesophilum]|uniref:Phosphate regulon transcriptional regulatory protein PhoB n=1 Tax=Candidatus Sulfobium mesophilum TaxID=2016548 RepID=A0A2U3QET8_9BACT|nr:Transcriptional regulatory protein YycF [Candidatus Sulfobium mesophilum]
MADRPKILVVDDEADLLDLISYNLTKEGYEVSTASDGGEALTEIRKARFDLVVLDLMLPGIQGMELCRIIRSDPKTEAVPIIMLTAKGEEVDRVLGLEMGADDYITKPFSPRELIARIRAVLRRTGEKSKGGKVLRTGNLLIDTENYTVTKKEVRLDLSATEFRILLYLVERRGKVFSREQLLDAAWKDEAFVEPRTVDVHIRRLRAQIEDDPSNPSYIKTKRGIGYYVDTET